MTKKRVIVALLFLIGVGSAAWAWAQVPVPVVGGIGTAASIPSPPVLTILPTPTPVIATPPPTPSPSPPTGNTPVVIYPQGMDWLANTEASAPTFAPDEVRDPALLAGGISSQYNGNISAAFGAYEANRVNPTAYNEAIDPESDNVANITPQGLTPANGHSPVVWSVDECNWALDVLESDLQMDAAAQPQDWYSGWAHDWAEAIDIADDNCLLGEVTSYPAVQGVIADFQSAELIHQADYGGATDAWDLEWGDAYLALAQLFAQLPVQPS